MIFPSYLIPPLYIIALALSEAKCIGIFQQYCAVAGKRKSRLLTISISVKRFIVDQIEVDAFTWIVAKPDIGNNRIDSAIILDKCSG